MSFFKSHHRRPIYDSGPPQDSSLSTEKPRDLPSRRSSGAWATTSVPQSPVQVAALERLVCLVKAGSRTVPRSFPFGSLRLPRVPLGGFATSRTPLVAVAARGAVDNINDDDVKMLIIYCSYPAFFLKSVVWAQHFYNLMCENAFAAPHILCNKTKNLLYLQKRLLLWIRDLQTRLYATSQPNRL